MGQEEEALVPATMVFSWEHEPAVSKKSSAWPTKPTSPALVGVAGDDDMPESPKKMKPPPRRLSVPPPPGRLPLSATKTFSRARAVRPEDDPFLAAYLACTANNRGVAAVAGGRNGGGGAARERKGQRRLTWAGLGRGLGLSCKSSNGVVEESMVKVAKLPEVHPRDRC